jgi:ATP-dependent HslUV protease, peptidase subunit HslV
MLSSTASRLSSNPSLIAAAVRCASLSRSGVCRHGNIAAARVARCSGASRPFAAGSASSPYADRHGTTIVCVRKNNQVCMMGDGMVSQGSMIVKPNAVKIRRIVNSRAGSGSGTGTDSGGSGGDSGGVTVVGFAGSTADAFTLMERLEGKLDEYPGQLARSCVELAKGWRTDKYLRRLEASLIVADATVSLELTGNGDVLESHDGILGVGSGSPYAIGK